MTASDTATLIDIGVLLFSYSLAFAVYRTLKNKRIQSVIQQPPWRIATGSMVVVGSIAIIVGIVAYQKQKIPSNFEYTKGTVNSVNQVQRVSYEQGSCYNTPCFKPDIYYTYDAKIDFAVGSNTYSFTENIGSAPISYRANQIVRVAYNPDKPTNNPRDVTNTLNNGVGQVATIIGFVFALSGSVILYVGRKR